ncbi:glutamate-cysteine ligase [Grosmannia clavigera kw1407]|uniref:Glutamate--cysteine ligase n=1 Tax=Grosmannia clavigera (strain kw1407 / UAMH 11150) TaxID=655863 RepID=F0XSX7_GROCL|nr:glutamate-cysteine ligase [Grosmannia clavigera kw1407]EFW99358.1 glutamate-cysteine ligase [Grosmannia clavigera kw1407]
MGLLQLGTALDWPEAKKHADQVRKWGILVEYLVVKYDKEKPRVVVSLRQADILDALANDASLAAKDPLPVFHPEFGRYMLESTPGKPWGIELKELLDVEPNMKIRRIIAKDHMNADEYPITLTTFPRLGSPGVFSDPHYPVSGPQLRSQFVPDEIANPHIRFPTLAANIRSRRGRKVQVNVPVFRDVNTPWPWKDPTVNFDLHQWPEDSDERNGAAPDNFIHMDAMAFGMGSCCLQITFQAKNITEGRRLYDQLSPLGPILLALTAATPVYKGFLADTDVRWNQISSCVDDRTPEELGEEPLKNSRWQIPKSRYASNSTYISTDPNLRPEYFDPDLVIDEDIKAQLMQGGMDDLLATHFAHLFIRDPIVIFSEDLQTLDLAETNHFENIQSTNWQHMRFKPPPPDNSIGWRVEFRPMEVQITDFENAAFSVFIVLITRAILSFGLNFYIPIVRVTENMETAHIRDAVLSETFYFRKNVFQQQRQSRHGRHRSARGDDSGNTSAAASGTTTPSGLSRPQSPALGPVEDEYRRMSINEIINGTGYPQHGLSNNGTSDVNGTGVGLEQSSAEAAFPGLIPLVESYLDSVNVDVQTRCQLSTYLDLIRKRASGELWTSARWIRAFVKEHPDYKQDSAVPESVTKDLVGAVIDIGAREETGGGWKDLDIPEIEKLMGSFKGF